MVLRSYETLIFQHVQGHRLTPLLHVQVPIWHEVWIYVVDVLHDTKDMDQNSYCTTDEKKKSIPVEF